MPRPSASAAPMPLCAEPSSDAAEPQGLTSGAVSVLAGVASLAALLVAAPSLAGGSLSGPGLAVVVLVPMAVFEVFGPVPLALASWRQVRSAAQRIADAVPEAVPDGTPPRRAAATGAAPILGAGLELTGVRAHWPARGGVDGDAGRLDDIALRLGPGERVLVTGPSGAGKTTLAHVLTRFLDYEGSYRVGGIEARDISGDDLRRTVGIIEQSPYLFDESVRQNLLFAREGATDDELWTVLERVGLDPGSASAAASTPESATGVGWCPAGRLSVSRSRGRCCATSRCSCSTSPPRASIPRHPTLCSSTCSVRSDGTGPSCWSRTSRCRRGWSTARCGSRTGAWRRPESA